MEYENQILVTHPAGSPKPSFKIIIMVVKYDSNRV